MSTQARNYPHRLLWFRTQRTTDASTGDKPYDLPAVQVGLLWGRVEETYGQRQEDYGAERTGSQADVYVRNLPALDADTDRLEWDGRTWRIDHIRRNGRLEIICRCYSFDALEDV